MGLELYFSYFLLYFKINHSYNFRLNKFLTKNNCKYLKKLGKIFKLIVKVEGKYCFPECQRIKHHHIPYIYYISYLFEQRKPRNGEKEPKNAENKLRSSDMSINFTLLVHSEFIYMERASPVVAAGKARRVCVQELSR